MTIADLQARIDALEGENEALRAERDAAERAAAERGGGAGEPKRGRGRGRLAAAIVLVVLGVLLAPVAVIASWARAELVDTERFVATFAPLVEDPAVQQVIVDEVSTAIEGRVDIDALTADLVDGIQSLDIPDAAKSALGLLEKPAAEGLKNLLHTSIERIVESPAFADVWANALRVTHTQFVAAMEGDPDAALAISDSGQLSIQLAPVIESVKERLLEQGIGFAASIPTISGSIVIAESDALAVVQTVYALAVGVGTWLPFVVLALLVGGVLVAPRRNRALLWTSGALLFVMLLTLAGFGIGRWYFLTATKPYIASDAAGVIYDQLLELMNSVAVAVAVLAALTLVIAWFAGPSRAAVRTRAFAEGGFARTRAAAARAGIGTGAFGAWLDRAIGFAYGAIAVVAAFVIVVFRPISVALVLWTVVIALLVVLLLQFLRRPPGTPEPVRKAAAAPRPAAPDDAPVATAAGAGSVGATSADATETAVLTDASGTAVLVETAVLADAPDAPAAGAAASDAADTEVIVDAASPPGPSEAERSPELPSAFEAVVRPDRAPRRGPGSGDDEPGS
ncbi:hypothetical protein ACDF64_00860 [Agromyces sp. MMS24-JH15]|uniref:hypothetical protein n=1 Tax=Agromyces sp. MMS24-JH15 TaxID=3243765 RepID=UPI0037479919